MILHVLPGDAQLEEFKKTGLDGEIVVCREALIDGDVRPTDLEEFWRVREDFLRQRYPEVATDYREAVVAEFDKLLDVSAGTEVNLWFEYDLFCQVNMWFCVWLLRESRGELYRVAPIMQKKNNAWDGFGNLTASELTGCHAERLKFTDCDIELGVDLWTAYQAEDHTKLRELSSTESACFPYLKEAIEAEVQKETRPREILVELRQAGVVDFDDVFAAFRDRAGVYGYGDAQVKRILDEI